MERKWHELLMDDHNMTEKVFAAIEKAFEQKEAPSPAFLKACITYLTEYVENCHNKKEENFLFPRLEKAGVPRHGGPLAVMLMEHKQQTELIERIRESYQKLGSSGGLENLKALLGDYISLCKNHYWKENDILFPMGLRVLTPQDEKEVIEGIQATEALLGDRTRERYYALAQHIVREAEVQDLSYNLDRETLAAILNTLPVELSFVDAEDTVRYFSHEDKDKIFARSRGVIGTKVQNCHPQKSLHKVNQILEDFKAGKRDVAEFWIDFRGKKVHIRYFPVRDKFGNYIGCLEVVQDITQIQKLQGEKRLLDEP